MKYLYLLAPIFIVSCLNKTSNSSQFSDTQPESMKVYDFCLKNYPNSKVWSRPTIESNLRELVDNPPVHNTILESYPNAYITMTAQRDIERCGSSGKLVSGYEISNYINHQLADLMTRYLDKITHDCSVKPSLSKESYGICYNQKRFLESKNLDSVTSFLESTSVYISSHIAISLSAVLLDDEFWDNSSYHMAHSSKPSHIRDRIFYTKRYKVNYDAFNEFLAANLTTVSKALKQECLISGNTLVLGAKVGENIPALSNSFGKIRDKAFDEAIDLAIKWQNTPDSNPMIVKKSGKYTVDFSQYDYDFMYTDSLRKLEDFSKGAVVNDLSRIIYSKLLGGLTTSQIVDARKNCKR